MAFETLHIHHASLNGRQEAQAARNDSDLMFGREADVVTVTEMGAEPQRGEWLAAANRAGYQTLHGRGGQAIAWKGIKDIDKGITPVIDDPAGPVRGHRDLPWVKFEFANRKITVCSTHWVDDVEAGGERREQWYRQTNAVISRMEWSVNDPDNIGFFTGDVNVHFDKSGPGIDPYRRSFNEGNLRMVWSELNSFPDTGPHGGTIDVIGRRGGGTFTEAQRAQVYTSGAVISDHNPISAWYRIEVRDGQSNDSGSGGGGHSTGGGPVPPPYNPPAEDPPPIPNGHSGKGRASIGGQPFRLNPTSINWEFTAKVADIATVGGKVVQVLGTKVSDLKVSGTFGRGGWREQEQFLIWMKRLADRAVDERSPIHFRYPNYGWDFRVIVKAYTTPDGGRSIVLDNGIVAPRWDLTLFVVEGSSALERVATDAYIARLSKGIGWKQTRYNGPLDVHALSDLLGGISVEQYLEETYGIGSVQTGNTTYEVDPETGDVSGPVPSGGTPDKNRIMGRSLASMMYGWEGDQWTALETLWTHESNWDHTANNHTSSAYGIPQALVDAFGREPGLKASGYFASKVSGEGLTSEYSGGDPEVQIKWGLRYIKDRYGDPVTAWAYWQNHNSY